MSVRALFAVSLLALGACTARKIQFADGGLDAGATDGPTSELPGALALDLSVTGCDRYDVGVARCTGTPPLALSFAPVGSPALARFVWSFGDGTPNATERAPSHTYALPGSYDVSVVADGPAGSVSRTRPKLVEVKALGAGAACNVDAQCDGTLRCRCANGACGAAFTRGLCTTPCPATSCGGGATCAALAFPEAPAPDGAVSASGDADASGVVDGVVVTDATASDGVGDAAPKADAAASDGAVTDADARETSSPQDAALATDGAEASPFRDAASDASSSDASPSDPSSSDAGSSCLAACVTDADCSAGLACRAAPAGALASATRWVTACLPPAFHEIGAPCRDEHGVLDAAACASGVCADLGALGACSAACGVGAPCPAGSACATFGNGRALCVASCGAGVACARDPLLRCEPSGAPGALGFQVSPAVTGTAYCAPRTCTTSSDCGSAGVCTPLGTGAHCARP